MDDTYTITVYDATTRETVVRAMTDEERAQHDADMANAETLPEDDEVAP
jgi:hypothetical protein